MSSNTFLPVVTMGEPAGIGGEIVLKAWLSARNELSPFYVLDSPQRLKILAKLMRIEIDIREISDPSETEIVFQSALPVLNINLPANPIPGELNPENGSAVINAIKKAVELVQENKAGAIVTNPINKQALYQCGFSHPGHTEYLAALGGVVTEPVMMLASERLRVVPVTRHVSIKTAIDILTPDLIVETALITDQALRQDFAISTPRLAIAGLNPHAGEGGAMGSEEKTLIEPAMERLKTQGINITGPHPPDTLFHAAARETYDAVLCMYHDQALIPIKTLDFDTAVNITLGLPFIRTSPDHGTALDIAGTGTANEQSLITALKLAGTMAKNRAEAIK